MFLVICAAHGDKTISDGSAAFYPAYTDPANIVIVVYGRYQNLQRSLLFASRSRYMVDDGIKNGLHVWLHLIRFVTRNTVTRRGINYGKFKLFIACTKLNKQTQNLIHDLIRTCARTINLVDNDYRNLIKFKSFPENEPRLRHTAFKRIYEKQNAVYHLENALNLTAEIGMAGSVNDINSITVIINGCIL